MILFPLGNPTFSGLGPEGISMFYVSCIVSQLTYSLGGSIFKGGIGSEMVEPALALENTVLTISKIEVVPFFHKMAFTILARVGESEDRKAAVLATTITAYAISSVLTGAVFYIMGLCKLGSLIGFFPRHILIGCIGGVGWFLVATGLEISARLNGNLEYNISTLHKLFQSDTVALWVVPLVLATILHTTKRWVKHPLTDATFFLSIIAVFYYYVAAIEELTVPELRDRGWIFAAPDPGKPFYSFYELYNWRRTDWRAVLSTVPAMLALTFFGVLHVPINIPALGLSSGEDNVDVDRELRAHGISNALSGCCGSIQARLLSDVQLDHFADDRTELPCVYELGSFYEEWRGQSNRWRNVGRCHLWYTCHWTSHYWLYSDYGCWSTHILSGTGSAEGSPCRNVG